jgi:hypothetical protein
MTESGESRQERAFASLEVAMAADPRINPFGMYAGDAPSGLTMFHWYASEEARFRAVAEDLPFVLDDDADDVSNEVRSVLASRLFACKASGCAGGCAEDSLVRQVCGPV